MNEKNNSNFDLNKLSNELSYKFIAPISASFAIIPSFYWFARKAAIQSGLPLPYFNFENTLLGGLKTAPTIASTVGLQLILQESIQTKLNQYNFLNNWQSSFLASSIVGFLTAIPLGIFQGQTLGLSAQNSLKSAIMPKTICLIGLRESGFIAGVQISTALAELINPNKDHPILQNICYFASSAGVSILTHPIDSLATRNFKPCPTSKSLYAGAISRAIASGIFNIAYQSVKTVITRALTLDNLSK
jgi:hypothetical protein